jgi:GntR family transcriptional regulator
VELSINPNTIQKAYSVLEKEGYIYPVKGKGNFVSGNQELKAKKQEVFYRSLGQLVEQGKVLDIKKKDFLEKAEAFYEEGQV